jgi:hypothetical protein
MEHSHSCGIHSRKMCRTTSYQMSRFNFHAIRSLHASSEVGKTARTNRTEVPSQVKTQETSTGVRKHPIFR